MSGKLITIEGIEGAGKSTAISYIHDYLTKTEQDHVVTREPGGTKIAEEIRALLLNPDSEEIMDPKTELLLMFASRAQHLAQLILPALQQNKWVLCDRFTDATYAYQGAGRGLDMHLIALLEKWVVGELKPDLTILLDIDPVVGLSRSKQRGPQDRFEKEKVAFFEKIRHAYLERAHAQKNRFYIIDAAQSLGEVQEQLRKALEKVI